MGGINIKILETVEVLSMKIQGYVCCNRCIFQNLCFLGWGKICSSIYSYRIYFKEKDIQLSCVGRCRNVYFVVNGCRASNSIGSLEHYCSIAIQAKLGDLLT